MDTWHARIPAMQERLQEIRLALWKALPNTDSDGKPFSGSYWCTYSIELIYMSYMDPKSGAN
jgi:hypothetical protein